MPSDAETWQEWERRIRWTAERVEAKGGEVGELTFLPPVPEAQVDELRAQAGIALPADFAAWLTRHCGGFEVWWSLGEIETPLSDWVGGGNGDGPFVGAALATPLLRCYRAFDNLLHNSALYGDQWNDDPEILTTRKVIRQCFPLYQTYGGGGDSWVLRCDIERAEVLHLDHELFYQTTGEAIIGVGFTEFMEWWTHTGILDLDNYAVRSSITNEETNLLDDTLPAVVEWLRWLAADD